MNKAIVFTSLWALAMSAAFADESAASTEVVQDVDPVIHIDSRQLNLDFGKDTYRISLTPVTKQDYKILGLAKPADASRYSTFMYCALRKVAIDRGFEYWLLLPSRSADSGYVGYVRTQAEAGYIAEKSLKRLVIHAVHQPPVSARGCGQSS
jgi:hypothetical protein